VGFLIDTNVLSELRKRERANAAVLDACAGRGVGARRRRGRPQQDGDERRTAGRLRKGAMLDARRAPRNDRQAAGPGSVQGGPVPGPVPAHPQTAVSLGVRDRAFTTP